MGNLSIETAGTEEEAAERLEAALGMEINKDGEGECEGEKWGEATQRTLGDLYLLTQDAYPSGKTLAYARNGFNKLSRLAMLWTVWHRWPEGTRFPFNFYRHWAHFLLRQTG